MIITAVGSKVNTRGCVACWRLGSLLVLAVWAAGLSVGCNEGTRTLDLADSAHCGAWVRHPICGDVSYDSFVHAANNPVCRGEPPYEWPVNGSLFCDPVSSNWYLYVGHYSAGYALKPDVPMRCTVFSSSDRGRTWQALGPVFTGPPFYYQGEVSPIFHAPDASVNYSDGRYHMCFDWTTENTTWANAAAPPPEANSGAGYAWSDRPEGPFQITPWPIASTREQKLLLGKYRRLYISTLIKRQHDWLLLTDTDSGGHFGWALLGMTAAKPEGPFSEAQLLVYPESPRFTPVPLEFNPVFTHEGFIYMPATSIGLNRNYQAMYRVPIEQAMQPEAWQVVQSGSLWHAEPVEHEHYGIWGQTISGFVGQDGMFNVMFPARDPKGMGTINIASRPWDKPLRDRGFVISGHEGPSLCYLRHAGRPTRIEIDLQQAHGTISLLWDAGGILGTDIVQFPSAIHPQALRDYAALELGTGDWSLVRVDRQGERTVLATGPLGQDAHRRASLTWSDDAQLTLRLGDQVTWTGQFNPGDRCLGVLASAHSHALFHQFVIAGRLQPANIIYLYSDALLGAAEKRDDWQIKQSAIFRTGMGVLSTRSGQLAKWNFEGSALRLWAPKSPGFGRAELSLDGQALGNIDFSAAAESPSQCVYELQGLDPDVGHALFLRSVDRPIPLDVLEVEP